ncbi:hypothetical protein M8J75_001013 [Diaphorina citri]|nr:hypothetical protein M8J75_001013 [Diaphorina citri]
MTLSSVKFVVHFMFLVDLLLGALDDIDEYNGFAYSSFHGPVSGDVKPVYFTDPYTPGQTLVDYLSLPATPNFPYEEIMNSIPDLHDIPIPHYDSVDTIHNKQYETTDIPYNNHEESKAYDSTQNYLEPKFYEDTNSLRSAHQSGDEGNLYDSSNVVQSDAYNNLEEGPSNRVYDSTEVNNINNLYDPKIETTSAEYESYYQ